MVLRFHTLISTLLHENHAVHVHICKRFQAALGLDLHMCQQASKLVTRISARLASPGAFVMHALLDRVCWHAGYSNDDASNVTCLSSSPYPACCQAVNQPSSECALPVDGDCSGDFPIPACCGSLTCLVSDRIIVRPLVPLMALKWNHGQCRRHAGVCATQSECEGCDIADVHRFIAMVLLYNAHRAPLPDAA